MKILIYSILSLFLPAILFAQATIELGPMLGHVDDDEAKVWVKLFKKGQLGLQIDGRDVEGPTLTAESDFCGHVSVSMLNPEHDYPYTVLVDGKPVSATPHGTLRTAPKSGTPLKLRVAFSSCFGTTGKQSEAARAELAKQDDLDLMLELGDNHYADSTDPTKQRLAYGSQRGTKAWAESVADLPTYAIWDDHDYGPNDSDRLAKGKIGSLNTFKQQWANPSYGEPNNPGIYCTFHRGDVQFFLLDDRYHRDPNSARSTPNKTLLGKQQKAWLKQKLNESTARIKIIALGSEFQLNGHKDSYTSFKEEQLEMLNMFKTVEGVILVSGDRHFTGAYQIRGETLEVTAGPMGSKNYPTNNLPDMFINHGKGKLFAVLDIDTTGKHPKVIIEVHQVGQGKIQSRGISWEELNGSKRIAPLKK